MSRVIIDMDAGIDDIFALLLLIYGDGSNKFNIEGITCVRGNTTVHCVYKNIQRILKLIKKEIPVYIGEDEPIITQPQFYFPHYYGEDGFGDKFFESENDFGSNDTKLPAYKFINDIVQKNPKEISIICCGPLTNIALAMKTNPKLGENIKELFIMGGNYEDEGNAKDAGFNFKCDVEAVNIVFQKAKCPILLVPKETCEATQVSVQWRTDVLGAIKNPVMELLNSVELQYYLDEKKWICYDSYLIAALMNSDTVQKDLTVGVRIELFDPKSRGQIFLDKESKVKVKVVSMFNTDLFKTMIYDALNNIKL